MPISPAPERTSIELNALPLYASANSVASASCLNFRMAIDRFGAESLDKAADQCERLIHATYQKDAPDHAQVLKSVGRRRDESQEVRRVHPRWHCEYSKCQVVRVVRSGYGRCRLLSRSIARNCRCSSMFVAKYMDYPFRKIGRPRLRVWVRNERGRCSTCKCPELG